MVQYVTRSRFSEFAKESIAESERLIKSAQDRDVSGSTFLSHSSKDEEILPGVVKVLENHGGQIYIDKKDESLPPYTNKETANQLKGRILNCSKFIILATENSKDSKWVPWELGLADGYKTLDRIAVLPAVDNDKSWTEREYLGLYDRIVWGSLEGYSDKVWMVWDHRKNTACTLRQWLQRR